MKRSTELIIVGLCIFLFSLFLVNFPATGILVLSTTFVGIMILLLFYKVKEKHFSEEARQRKQYKWELSELKKILHVKSEVEELTGEVFTLKRVLGHYVYHNARLEVSISPKKMNFLDLSKHQRLQKHELKISYANNNAIFGKTIVPKSLFDRFFNNLKAEFMVLVNHLNEDHFIFEYKDALITLPYLELSDMA